jgi:hypothetical protein
MEKQNSYRKWIERAICLGIMIILVVCSSISFYTIGYSKGRLGINIPPSDEYNIYMHFGTLPTLYAATHIFTHTTPSYLFFSRQDTFDISKMPKHVQVFLESTANNDLIISKARELVHDINSKSPASVINFFVDDFRLMVAYYALLTNGIPESRFNITLFSDGGGTYGASFTRNYADSFHYTMSINDIQQSFNVKQSGIENWNIASTHFEQILTDFIEHPDVSRAGQSILYGDGSGVFMFHPSGVRPPNEPLHYVNSFSVDRYSFIAAQRPNVRFWMQYPEYCWLRDDVSAEINSQILRATLSKVTPVDIVETLSLTHREAFFNAVLNNPTYQLEGQPATHEILDSMLLNTEKPVLIISGANLGTAAINYFGNGPDHFPETIINQIIKDFGNDYTLLFKPHPGFTADNNRIAAKGIGILPAQLPMEVLLWAYPNVFVGGYNSSLYLSVHNAGQVKFFIERIGEEGHLDNILYVLEQNGFFQNATKRYS